ncbi:MAG: radical SAM protein, partial [Thermofilaceae archaeon]
PLTHPQIVELVARLREKPYVETIAMETHGALLTERLAEKLDEAGLDRLNLSLDALDPQLARFLSGTEWFDVSRVIEVAEYIASSLRMDLLIAPVWVPGINDTQIPRIIEWALRIGAGKRWPPLGIQKYEAHKFGRKPKGVKPMSWRDFYAALSKWEEEYGVKLILRPQDFGIAKARPLPLRFRRLERVRVTVVGSGWLRSQWLGVARDRVITLVGVKGDPPVGRRVTATVLRAKHNIYVARVL